MVKLIWAPPIMAATWPAPYPDTSALLGSQAIVSVAVRDIGRAIAERFTSEGAAVAGPDRAKIAEAAPNLAFDRSAIDAGTDLVIDGGVGLS